MSTRNPPDAELLQGAARLADLPLAPERLAQLQPLMLDVMQALDAIAQCRLGETAPCAAYRAQWEG